MSRNQAKAKLNLLDFIKSMNGIYTTSIGPSTLDESPLAYKPIDTIIDDIKDTIEIQSILRPIYNFKAT
jgi:RNA-splicing ligase RtcB